MVVPFGRDCYADLLGEPFSMFIVRVISTLAVSATLALSAVPVQAETLKNALASAYANNPQIASALLGVKVSAEGIALARAGKMPSLSANAAVDSGFTVRGGTTSNSFSSSMSLSYNQTLFDNFKTDAGIESARALSEVAMQSLRNAEQNVLQSAATAYMNVVRDTQLVQLRAENVTFLKAQVSSANDRLQIGEGTKIDVSQAEARQAQAVASYKVAINSLRTSQASYARWVGHKPQNLSMKVNLGSAVPTTLDEAQSSADRNHPAILTAKAQLRAAQSSSEGAKAAFGPTLALIGSLSNSQDFTLGVNTTNAGVGLRLSIPIYAGGALGATQRQANLRQIKTEIDALATRDQVREAVISSWSGVQNALAQIESSATAVRSSQLALQGVIEERNVGQRTTLDVLNARAELTAVREGQIGAVTSRVVASVALIAAAGRLSAQELSLPVEIRDANGYIKNVEDVWQELRSLSD